MPIARFGQEFIVNSTTSSVQSTPAVAALSGGRFVATWFSYDIGDGNGTSIRARLIGADGTPIGADFIANTTARGNQELPAVTSLTDGRFVLMWTSADTGDGSGSCVRARVFESNGMPAGADFIVNSTTNSGQTSPAITGLADGRFVATWVSGDEGDGEGSCVRARVFNADGTPSGADFVVNSTAGINQFDPAITVLTDGRFVATWTSEDGGDGWSDCVRGRVFNANGTPAGSDFIVNSTIDDAQYLSSVATLPDGGFVATWTSPDTGDGSLTCIRARVFRADGTAGPDFIVNSTGAEYQYDPSITALADGRFVVAWASEDTGDGSSTCVRARLFNADGTPTAADFIVNQTTTSFQHTPAVAALPDGRFMVTFMSEDAGDGSQNCIRAQIFDPNTFNGTDADDTWRGSDVFADHIYGGAGADMLYGLVGDDVIDGGADDDIIKGGGGSDTLDGGDGIDTASFSGLFTDYTFRRSGDAIIVSGRDGVDTLSNFELASFGGLGFTISLANQAPTVASDGAGDTAAITVGEGSTAVTTFTATDANRDQLDYSITGGDDAARFRIDSVTGALSFIAAPDFEAPADADGNNTYVVIVRASDGVMFDDQTITVTVADADDGAPQPAPQPAPEPAPAPEPDAGPGPDTLTGTASDDELSGLGGDDLIDGGAGNDTIDGGDGNDTAVFSGNLGSYTIQDFGSRIGVSGPDGTDTLTGIEHLQFADATLTAVDDGDPLFDALYYFSRNTDVYFAGLDAREHFDAWGLQEGRNPNAFFDVSGYAAVSQDGGGAGVNPLVHYHQAGWQEGRDPSAWFDTTLYLLNNPDVAAADLDPLAHYLAHGAAEGREAYAAVASIHNGFDEQYYLFRNPDVAAAGVDPLAHFNEFGWREGRNPNGLFDTPGYLSHYADVAVAGINPLDHYLGYGWKEGRDPSTAFDTEGYLSANPDVAAAGVDPLSHYLQFGIYEGRQIVSDGVWG